MAEKQSCEFPESNPPDDEIKAIFENSKTIAVVGLSDKPEILGEKSYPDLASIPIQVDIVDIFRNIDAIPGIVDEAIKIKAKAVWMQLGLAHNESARKATAAGLVAVQSKCMKIEHQKLQ